MAVKIFLCTGYHSVYRELINFPPKNVIYLNKEPNSRTHKRTLKDLLYNAYMRSKVGFKSISTAFIPEDDFDLIHSSGRLILNKKPWMFNTEYIGLSGEIRFPRCRKIIERILSSKYCGKIVPWSNASREDLLKNLDSSGFEDKIEVVYPAMHKVHFKKHKESNRIRLLSVNNSNFYNKGGIQLLKVFESLDKKYDVNLTLISNPPRTIREKYKEYENINFLQSPVPREELFEKYFSKANIFILPSFLDSFGFVLLEAMAFGLPIVTTNVFAIPEIVEDGISGFLVDVPFHHLDRKGLFPNKNWDSMDFLSDVDLPNVIKEFEDKISIFVEDSSLRKKMGKLGKKKIENGKFSIKERNKKWERIYGEVSR